MTLSPEKRKRVIYEQLKHAFQPTMLEVIDESAKHRGHAGSAGGAGHYTIIMAAECFKNKSRVLIHREIYAVLDDLIPSQIHALQIKIECFRKIDQ
jgi:BolA family transcriptional regulator, general stress-responsive regulator